MNNINLKPPIIVACRFNYRVTAGDLIQQQGASSSICFMVYQIRHVALVKKNPKNRGKMGDEMFAF